MKVLVIGSNGRVGSALVKSLADAGYHVLAGGRTPGKGQPLARVEHVHIDLLSSIDTLAERMQEADAVYFVSGSRGANLLQIDLHGTVKTMQAAEKSGVQRYIMLSSIFALQPERWSDASLVDITDYNIAKHYADLYLTTQTALRYTILQPGPLQQKPGTGKISVNVQTAAANSIDNVVSTLIAILHDDTTIGKIVMMHDGDTPIAQALKMVQ